MTILRGKINVFGTSVGKLHRLVGSLADRYMTLDDLVFILYLSIDLGLTLNKIVYSI